MASLAVMACLTLLAIVSLEVPRTLLYLSARTEWVEVQVIDPKRSALWLPRAFHPDTKSCVERVFVTPAVGSVVRYVRPRGSSLRVIVEAAAGTTVSHGDGPARRLDEAGLLRYQVIRSGADCSTQDRVRLPAHGHLVVGQALAVQPSAMDEPSNLLISGKLQVFGRAITRLLWLRLDAPPFVAGALYPVNELQLPGGTVVQRALAEDRQADPAAELAAWSGFVDMNDADPSQALDIEATSNARSVAIYLPSPPVHQGQGGAAPDVMSLTQSARLLGDPNLRWIYGALTALTLVSPLAGVAIRGALVARRRRAAHPGAAP
jgi:hypothetical protein